MTCAVEQRQSVQRAADALEDCGGVVAVDVLPPAKGQFDAWSVDAVVRGPGIPPGVLRELVLEGLTLRPMPTRADSCSVVATA